MEKDVRKLQIIVKYQKLLNMVKKCQKCKKNMPKTSQKWPKYGQIKKNHRFSGLKLPQIIQWAETAKNGFKCFKMH